MNDFRILVEHKFLFSFALSCWGPRIGAEISYLRSCFGFDWFIGWNHFDDKTLHRGGLLRNITKLFTRNTGSFFDRGHCTFPFVSNFYWNLCFIWGHTFGIIYYAPTNLIQLRYLCLVSLIFQFDFLIHFNEFIKF